MQPFRAPRERVVPNALLATFENTSVAFSRDINANSLPDEGEVPFHSGDATANGSLDTRDARAVLAAFPGDPDLDCVSAACSACEG